MLPPAEPEKKVEEDEFKNLLDIADTSIKARPQPAKKKASPFEEEELFPKASVQSEIKIAQQKKMSSEQKEASVDAFFANVPSTKPQTDSSKSMFSLGYIVDDIFDLF